MEEDILKYSPTVMFRGTPCKLSITKGDHKEIKQFKHDVTIVSNITRKTKFVDKIK